MSAKHEAGAEQAAPVFDPYYNPRILGERFKVGEGPMAPFVPFRNGRFVPENAEQEDAVRRALRAYGPDKPERWKGDDRPLWRCRRCGFHSGNSRAIVDHEDYGICQKP